MTETRPPAKWAKQHKWHWLRYHSDPAWIVAVLWDNDRDGWLPCMQGGIVQSPETFYQLGWRWHAPARPPKHPHKDAMS